MLMGVFINSYYSPLFFWMYNWLRKVFMDEDYA